MAIWFRQEEDEELTKLTGSTNRNPLFLPIIKDH
jgi:hypothetical protein